MTGAGSLALQKTIQFLLGVPGRVLDFLTPRSISLPAPATVLQPANTTKAEDINKVKSVFMMFFEIQNFGPPRPAAVGGAAG